MSDNTQPASSRRALREKRRAEMEALLANSKAEQEAREQAAREEAADSKKAPQTPAAAPGKQTPKPSSTSGSNTSKPASGAKPAPQNAPKADEAPKKPANKSGAAKAAEAKKDTAKSGETQQNAKPEAAKKAAEKPAATKPAAAKPAAKPADAKTPNGKPADAKAGDSKPAAQSSESESGDTAGERASLRRARDREALRERRRLQEEVSQLTNHIPAVEPGDDPKPLTRRQLRLQALAEQQKAENAGAAKPVPVKPKNSTPSKDEDSPETTVMSVEEALAARRESAPAPPVDPNLLRDDDNDIDLEVLAHQREMAARAAIISRRAAERERLRQQNAKAGQEAPASDPFTGAMGNISELEDKVSRSGVPSPKTESVSLDLDSTGKIAPAKKPADKSGKKPEAKPAGKTPAKEAAKPAAQKSGVKKATPAAKPKPKEEEQTTSAQATSGDPVQMPRVEAVSAQGLQPLDAQTAGVRRANNMFLAMIAALAVGGIALVVGIIMMINN